MQQKTRFALFVAASMFLAFSSPTYAGKGGGGTSGTLDTSFGTGGRVSSPNTIKDVALQSDGRIVAVGYAGTPNVNTAISLERYNPNGSLDTTFGTSGRITEDLGPQDDTLTGVTIQVDGKIVAIGRTVSGNNFYPILIRYNPDGTRDTTFGSNGLAFSNPADEELAIQLDMKIAAVGLNGMARFLSNGTYDSSFGSGGVVPNAGPAYSVVLQPDGKIVATGNSTTPNNTDFRVVRVNSDGSFDNTFGANGIVMTDFGGGNDLAYSVKIQTGGQIVAAGNATSNTSTDFALARYTASGALDITFGTGGRTTTDFSRTADSIYDLALQPDDKPVAVGTTCSGRANSCIYKFALARYLTNGLLDSNFGNGGKVVSGFSGYANSVAIQIDGKIIVAGESCCSSGSAIERYNP